MKSTASQTVSWRDFLRSPFAWPLAVLTIMMVSIAVAATVTMLCPYVPRKHDEFANLLAADTLLHGRLSNPTPEIWEPLQTFHVIMEPSYAAKYPLGLALLIAVGMLTFGTPIAGSWIAAGLCAGSMAWMLSGAISRRWALLGGLLIALHPAMQVTWSQSLFGGWLTACGSALLLGGVLRLRRRFEFESALVAGIGVAVLALTRPFEGFVCTLMSAMALWTLWSPQRTTVRLKRAAACGASAMLPIGAALSLIALQNQSVTGSVFQLPYQIHEQNYGAAPLFVFGETQDPVLSQTGQAPIVVQRFHLGWSLDSFLDRSGADGWFEGIGQVYKTVLGYWGFSLTLLPMAACMFWLRHRVGKLLLLMLFVQVCASATVCWIFPHYLSPMLPWLVFLAVLGLKRAAVQLRRWDWRLGRGAVAAVVLCQLGLLGFATWGVINKPKNTWAIHRANMAAQLDRTPGRHLVIVEYSADHNVHEEWVYNGANLDDAKVIWARGERESWRTQLREHYGSERSIWHLAPDQDYSPMLVSQPVRKKVVAEEFAAN